MSETPEPGDSPSFSPPGEEEQQDPFAQEAPFGPDTSSPGGAPAPQGGSSFTMAWSVARMWIKEHQREAMLGAFATGVVVGAYLRD